MNKKHCSEYILIAIATLVCTNCNYIQHYQTQEQYSKIQENISLSTLDKVNEYTSRTPFHKTYEFEFNNSNNNPYALIFYLNESSFSKSIIKHRKENDLHREAIRIDESKFILRDLENNLPKASVIAWRQVANHIAADEARDGYHVMQEYIRLKIRDL
ncbi:MAG: hypothetical protein AB8B92_09210 [Gammaproteobacteria bacterium]